MIHAATGRSRVAPTLRMTRRSSTAKSLACKSKGNSPISSMNSTPSSAASIRPVRAAWALVKAPFSWPNNSASIKSLGRLAQSTWTKGRWLRALLACSNRATTSLPVPVSPRISTVGGAEETPPAPVSCCNRSTCWRMAAMTGLSPKNSIPSWACSRAWRSRLRE